MTDCLRWSSEHWGLRPGSGSNVSMRRAGPTKDSAIRRAAPSAVDRSLESGVGRGMQTSPVGLTLRLSARNAGTFSLRHSLTPRRRCVFILGLRWPRSRRRGSRPLDHRNLLAQPELPRYMPIRPSWEKSKHNSDTHPVTTIRISTRVTGRFLAIAEPPRVLDPPALEKSSRSGGSRPDRAGASSGTGRSFARRVALSCRKSASTWTPRTH